MFKRILSVIVSLSFIVTFMPLSPGASVEAATEQSLITDYQPTINEVIDASGFKHPGVGLTKDILENMRAQVLEKKEPWYSYYVAMTQSSYASKTITISNQSSTDSTKPANVAFNSQGVEASFIADGLKAYTQALMYYITGDETYRANAMQIIRIWSQMDSSKYEYYTDAHIHTGIHLNRMVTAAEILRYTSCQTEGLNWTDKDTVEFTHNLITPVIETFQHDNNYFMNQHSYPLIGAIAGYIFTGNKERYNEAVEWFTVNKTAKNQGFNGSIKQLFRLVDTNALTGEKLDQPVVQHVEMGRDQAHGGGDLTNAAIISRMLLAQETKVDPVDGTVSTKDNAVGPYEFLNDRILATANYFWKYMLGNDTSWTPVPYVNDENGNVKGIYQKLSDSYRGRMTTANFWDLYYYYTYVKGVNVAEKAPYYFEAFTKRIPSNYYYQGSFKQNWENVDGGGDFWLYIPKKAEFEGTKYLPKEQQSDSFVEIEERYTAFDTNTTTKKEGDTSFVEFNATEAGSRIAVLNLSYADRIKSLLIGIKFRTNGAATLELSKEQGSKPFYSLELPDTKGQWKYITYDMGISHVSFGQLDKDYSLLYMKVIGDGTTVDVDHLNVKAGEQLTPPAFQTGNSDMNIVAYVGAPVSLNFSATDSNFKDIISYESSGLPQGADINASTGLFNWKPTEPGKSSFIVVTSDGAAITTKKVNIVVSNDRASAVQAAISQYNSKTSYVTASWNHFKAVYDYTMKEIQTASDEAFYQQLLNLKSASENLQLLTPLLQTDGSMDYTNIVTSTFGDSISLLVDNNNNTYPVYTLAPDLYHILDFGIDYKVSASAFSFQSRMNFVDRMAGITVFGSNDMSNWTRLTSGETAFTDDMASIDVDDVYKNDQFRFIKFQMIHPQPDLLHDTIGNMIELGELRIFGQRHETNNKLESVSISSDKSVNGRIAIGNSVKLTIKAKEAIKNVKIKIQGQDASVSTQDNINWTGQATLNRDVQMGEVKFAVDYQTNDGTNGETAYFTTDNSKLFLVDESDLIGNVTGITNLLDSTTGSGRTAAETLKQVNYLFDNKSSTNSDFRLNGSGSGSYITFDFKEGNQVTLSSVELLARQDQYYGRVKGAVVQGSNDNKTWTTLTKAATASLDWQMLSVSSKVPNRYIRVYNAGSWFGNIAELKLHGAVKPADLTPPITTDDAPVGWVNKETKVNFKATDDSSGVAATYYTVDGGVQQTGNSVTLTTDGTHKLVYWSVNYAGNVEQSHTSTLKIDKTAPEITVSGFEKGSLSDALDVVPAVTIEDSTSGVDDSKTQVTLDEKPYPLGDAIQLYLLPLGKHTLIVTGSDLAGNHTRSTITFNTVASIEGMQQLVTRFAENNWIDNSGITNSLQQKLENNDLQSFIKEVKAQRGKHISNESAGYLLRDVNALLNK
jgi:large repetitive protein